MGICKSDKKDWTGDSRGIYITLGASNHTGSERESNDFYATDPVAIDLLLDAFPVPRNVWECACGQGHLSRRLTERGYKVLSTDKVDRGYGGTLDFLEADKMPDGFGCVLTNPPYKYAMDFVLHALDILPMYGLCIMFLKTTFLEGRRRYEKLFKDNRPMLVLQFVSRVLCAKNGDFQRMIDGGGSAVSYAWYIWRKGYRGPTILRWL